MLDVHDHGIASPDEKNKVACNYCGKEVSGFYRLKCHLGHLRGDVKPCEQVPSNVKDLMITQLRENKRRKFAKEADQSCHTDIPLKMNCSTSAKNTSKQADLEQIEEYVSKVKDSWAVTGCSIVIDEWEDGKRRHLINFLADSPEGTIYIGSFDISSHVGCLGILQKLLEFVIDNVGLKNVVQIIVADTVSWMWPATRQIVFKHKNVCWSLGASHYIGLMLYNIGMMEPYREILNKAKMLTEFVHGHTDVLKMFRSYFHGHDLVAKPYKIRSLMHFFNLTNIVTQKNNLKNMFASSEWTDSDWASTTQGKWVADLLRDITFWEKTRILLAATAPLVRILVPIDGVSKLQVGLIYYSILQAKEQIKKQLGNEAFDYMPFWNVIECVWDQYLYRPLYGVGYYLNPALLYTEKMYLNGEVEHGLKSCIFGMFEGRHVQDLISQQLQKYEQGEGSFKDGSTLQGLQDASPTEWWSRYGAQCPELQKLAIRILSQTCDGILGFDLKRSLAEELLSRKKTSNPIGYEYLLDITYVQCNMQLQNTKSKALSDLYVSTEEVDPMDD